MYRPYLFALAALAFAGCDRSLPTAPTGLKVPTSLAADKGTTTKINEVFDVSGFSFNNCNGDVVAVAGKLHEVFTVTDNGTSLDFKVHVNYDDLKGVGVPSGAEYHLNAAEQQRERDYLFPNLAFSGRVIFNEELVSQGGEPNVIIHITEYYSFDGTNFTFTEPRFSVECRG